MLQGQGHPRKMDKSTILQRTIDFLQKQKGREGEGGGGVVMAREESGSR